MSLHYSPRIVLDQLALCWDGANSKSYSGSGNTVYDLGKTYTDSADGSLVGAVFNADKSFGFAGSGERDTSPVGEYISFSNTIADTSPSIRPNGITYDLWIRFTGNQSAGHGVFVGSTTINHIEYRTNNIDAGGYWRTEAVTQNGYSFGGGGTNADGGHKLNEWFNLTLVFANDETNRPVRWYRDGVLFHTGNMTSGANPDTEYFKPSMIGRSTGTDQYLYAESLKGDIGQFKIYHKSLSQKEVTQNFNALRTRYEL
jgi:hypothetical protein